MTENNAVFLTQVCFLGIIYIEFNMGELIVGAAESGMYLKINSEKHITIKRYISTSLCIFLTL